MGKHSRNKGARGERELVNYLLERRIPAYRDWRTGEGAVGDLLVVWEQQPPGTSVEDMREMARRDGVPVEVKRRKKLPAYITGELNKDIDCVVMREDGGAWLRVDRI